MLYLGALFVLALAATAAHYKSTWSSLDARPLPKWYDQAKFGIFIHWGVYSVPSFGSEWFWQDWSSGSTNYVNYMQRNYPPNFTYPQFAPRFTAEFVDPNAWADLFADSGAKYVVLTSKHHEGYTLWPSKHSWNWNSVAVGPARDLVGDLATAIRNRTKLHFGLYYSLYEWYHPLYLQDKAGGFKTNSFVKAKTMPELYDIVKTYKPSIVWADGDWDATDTYWTSREFLAWLYNDSPVKDVVVTNDRWGKGCSCNHGGYFTCTDRYNPGTLQKRKWENAMTIDKLSWGFRRNADLSAYMTVEELIQQLVQTVSCGGNLLMNVGPTYDGLITPIFEERLRGMGKWLQVNGQAIYGTKPWTHQNDTITPGIWFTSKLRMVYAIVLKWPSTKVLHLGAIVPNLKTKVSMLGYGKSVSWKHGSEGIIIEWPTLTPSLLPCQWAWVLKFSNIKNERPDETFSHGKRTAAIGYT